MTHKDLSYFIDILPDSVVVINFDTGIIKDVNNKAEETFEYKKSELIGHRIEILVPDDVKEIHVKHLGKYAKDPGRRVLGSLRGVSGRKKDGTIFLVNICVKDFLWEEESFAVAIVRDMSEWDSQISLLHETAQNLNSTESEVLKSSKNELDTTRDKISAIADNLSKLLDGEFHGK